MKLLAAAQGNFARGTLAVVQVRSKVAALQVVFVEEASSLASCSEDDWMTSVEPTRLRMVRVLGGVFLGDEGLQAH